MGCMDELMDKNLPYFVGGNLATLYIAHINASLQHTMTCAAARRGAALYFVVLCYGAGLNVKAALTSKLLSVDDRRQTDRVIVPKHAGLRRCHWPRPHHAAPLPALARS